MERRFGLGSVTLGKEVEVFFFFWFEKLIFFSEDGICRRKKKVQLFYLNKQINFFFFFLGTANTNKSYLNDVNKVYFFLKKITNKR